MLYSAATDPSLRCFLFETFKVLSEPNLEKIVVGFATTTHASNSLDILDIETKGFELILIKSGTQM